MTDICPPRAVAGIPPIIPRISRPVSRRHMLGIMTAGATAVALSRWQHDDQAAAGAAPTSQPPPSYAGIVGLL